LNIVSKSCVWYVNFVSIYYHQFMITYSIMCTTKIKLAFGFYFSFFLEKIHLVENSA